MKASSGISNRTTVEPDSFVDAARDFLPKHRKLSLAKIDAEMTLQLGPAQIGARIGVSRATTQMRSDGRPAAKGQHADEDEFYPLPAGLA